MYTRIMRLRPPNCRLFIGNLASERTSKSELRSIFSKYGDIIEEPVIRRCFGFVQFDNPESAQQAIHNENGRLIGNMKIECSLADNREPKYKSGQRKDNRRQERRDRAAPYPDRKRRDRTSRSSRRHSRSRSPPRDQRREEHGPLCLVVYTHSNEEDLVSRTQQQLKDQGINADNKIFHSPNARPGAVDPIEDSFRRKIPFLLFVNRGGSYMFDLQIILPISSATTYRAVSLEDAVNIMKDFHSKNEPDPQKASREYSTPYSRDYQPHPGWNSQYPAPPEHSRLPSYETGNAGPPSVPPPSNTYYPNPYNPPVDRYPPYTPENRSYAPYNPQSSGRGNNPMSEPQHNLYNPPPSYYPQGEPSRVPKESPNSNASYPPAYPPRTNSNAVAYYDYKAPQGYQPATEPANRAGNQPPNQPVDPQQLAKLLWLLQSQQGGTGDKQPGNAPGSNIPPRTTTQGAGATLANSFSSSEANQRTNPTSTPNTLSTEDLLAQQLLLQRNAQQHPR
uniref:RRM domain-containing protein n=1 Tax=Vannella robusta TaxID=1487602 RepID=A0A7S4IB38_9EUKA